MKGVAQTDKNAVEILSFYDATDYLTPGRLKKYLLARGMLVHFDKLPYVAFLGGTHPSPGYDPYQLWAVHWPYRGWTIYKVESSFYMKNPDRPWTKGVWYYSDPYGKHWRMDGNKKIGRIRLRPLPLEDIDEL